MKTISEEEVQALLDAYYLGGETVSPNQESEDWDLYATVYKELAKDNTQVPSTFANRVAVEAFYQEERKKVLTNRLLSIAFIAVLIVLGFLCLRLFGFAIAVQVTELLKTPFTVPIVLLVLVGFVLETMLSKKVLKPETSVGAP